MSNNNNIKIFDGLVSKTKAYLIIIAILLIALCFFEIKLIIPSIIIYFLILVYTRWTNKKRTAELSEHIKELTINVDKVSKRSLINSPFPLIIVETNGNVIWKSTKFVQEFNNIDINTYLNTIVKELKLEIENSNLNLSKIYNNYPYLSDNLLWLSSFCECCKKDSEHLEIYEENDDIVMELKLSNNKYFNCRKLYLEKGTGKPRKMVVQDNNKKDAIYILYKEIKINN